MSIDKKELTKLSPEERIKKLKLMEEERKKEVDEIEELIKKSMQELKTEKLAEDITPEQRTVDISRIFESTGEQRLERTAREEAPATALTKGAKSYQAVAQTYQDYSQPAKEQRVATGPIGERINIAESYVTEGEKTASKLDASRATAHKLKKETGLH